MKVLISYENYLLKKRGKVEPKVGDKIKTIAAVRGNKELQDNVIRKIEQVKIDTYFSKYPFELYYRNTTRYIEDCWVEIELPEIGWEQGGGTFFNGRIFGFKIFHLSYSIEGNINQRNYNFCTLTTDNPKTAFQGTLEECKNKANQLLWKI